jgi:chorismate mutase
LKELQQHRRTIDEIDRALVALLSRRLAVANEIAVLKRRQGLPPVDPAREEEILRAVSAAADPAQAAVLTRLFSEILAASKAAQRAAVADLL